MIEEDGREKYSDPGKLPENSIFPETADSSLILPDTVGYSADIIKFTGEFYTEIGYPKNYPKPEQNPEQARVFRYKNYKVIRSYYRDFVNKILNPGYYIYTDHQPKDYLHKRSRLNCYHF